MRRLLRPVRVCVLLLGALALSSACGRAPAALTRRPGLNILLITIDTWRADAAGAYGNSRAATPLIDRLAATGVRFDAAHAHAVVTLPSHVSVLSGAYPTRHGVHENAGYRVPDDLPTLATRLKAAGYRTGAFVSAFPLDRRFGLTRGFDVYDDGYGKSGESSAFRVPERPGAQTVAAARAWIDGGAGPWFAWVHLYEPHFPYAPPEPFASRFAADPYLGEVAAADAALAPLVTPLIGETASPSLVVLTSDHGESLGEHGETTHGLFAYEATLHVPLVITSPALFGHRSVSVPVRHVDIVPTVLDAIGAPVPNDVDGRSLLGALEGQPLDDASSYFESLSASLNRGWAPLHGLSRGALKYIDLPIPELYDIAQDREERTNLIAGRAAEADVLQRALAATRQNERGSARASESAETRERLRSLGYATGAAAPRKAFTDADDPKRLIAIDRAIERVVSLYQQGDLAGAIAAAQAVERERPDMPIALVHLAFLYNQAGNHAGAVRAILHALELNPLADETAALAGAYLTEAGRAREAADRLAPYAASAHADVDVLIAYGVALAETGRGRAATAAFDRARAADPTSGLPMANIGMIHLQAGDTAGAEQAFRDALAADPALARAHNGLGVIAARRGDLAAAAAQWEQAVAADPHDFQTLFNLGELLIRMGRPADARGYWERYIREAPASETSDVARVRAWLRSH